MLFRSRHDLLAQASSVVQSAGTNVKPNPDITVRQVLDRAAGLVDAKLAEQPMVQASIEDTISATYLDLGLYKEGLDHAERAIRLRRSLLGGAHPATLLSLDRQAAALRGLGKYP